MSKHILALKAEGKRISERIAELGAAVTDGEGGVKLIADEKVVAELKELGAQLEGVKAQVGTFEGAEVFLSNVNDDVPIPPVANGSGAEEAKSLVEQLLGSRAEYKAERFTQNLNKMYEGKADFNTVATNNGGSLIAPDRIAPYFPNTRQLRVRDAFFMPGSTSGGMVEWFELTTEESNAAGVAEGNQKPEAAYQFTLRQSGVRTVATTLPVTNQILADYGQLVTQVQNRMNVGLKFQEDVDLLWGAGSPDLDGLLNTTGVLDAATAISIDAADTYLDIIRKMMTACASGIGAIKEGHIPTAVGVTPLIKQDIDLLKDDNKNYIFAVVQTGGGVKVWGIDIVESNAFRDPTDLNNHHIVVGAKTAGQIWDRENANVAIGLVNDQFLHNMQTIRVEERLASGLYAPSSYCDYEVANVS